MINEKEIEIPKEIEREITFMLFNYSNIDNLIKERENDLIDKINISNSSYLKSIKEDVNTLENIVIKIATDKKIKRLKEWKKIINLLEKKLCLEEDKRYYQFFILKYIEKVKEENITKILNIDKKTSKRINLFLKGLLYSYAIDRKLCKEAI